MKTTYKSLIHLVFMGAVILLAACGKDNPEPSKNTIEKITTVEVHFLERGTSNNVSYKWEDLDGIGGNAPYVQDMVLGPGKTYDVFFLLMDKTKSPVDTVSKKIEDKAVLHRFYFEPSVGSKIIVSNLDNIPTGIPFGATSAWTTGLAGNGTIKITLRHYENGGKQAGDPVDDGKSSTDAEVIFNTKVR